VNAVLRELGIDPSSTLSLRLDRHGIYAEVFAKDENGKKFYTLNDEIATHNVFIKFD
jgi:hypothetical protein